MVVGTALDERAPLLVESAYLASRLSTSLSRKGDDP